MVLEGGIVGDEAVASQLWKGEEEGAVEIEAEDVVAEDPL